MNCLIKQHEELLNGLYSEESMEENDTWGLLALTETQKEKLSVLSLKYMNEFQDKVKDVDDIMDSLKEDFEDVLESLKNEDLEKVYSEKIEDDFEYYKIDQGVGEDEFHEDMKTFFKIILANQIASDIETMLS